MKIITAQRLLHLLSFQLETEYTSCFKKQTKLFLSYLCHLCFTW